MGLESAHLGVPVERVTSFRSERPTANTLLAWALNVSGRVALENGFHSGMKLVRPDTNPCLKALPEPAPRCLDQAPDPPIPWDLRGSWSDRIA